MDVSLLKNNNCDLYFTNAARKLYAECSSGQDILADTRSMAYYVIGKAKTQMRQCVLICLTSELTDMLPAITEAFYQNICMTIISVGESEINCRIAECYEVVTDFVIVNTEFDLGTLLEKKGIKLMMVEQVEKRDQYVQVEVVGLGNLFSRLNSDKEWEVYSYCDAAISDVKVEKRESCSFSLYEILGQAWVSDKIICIIVDSSKLLDSINAFNIRYIKDNLLIVSVGKEISTYS